MNDQLERDIRNLFCNTGELSRDEVTGILLGLLERIQHLEQLRPEQEPVAWADMDVRGEDKGLSWTPGYFHKTPLYATPPHRKPLTDEQIVQIELGLRQYNNRDTYDLSLKDFARAIEAAHGITGEQHG